MGCASMLGSCVPTRQGELRGARTSAEQRRHERLLDLSAECKIPANTHICCRTLFPSFPVIYSGCSTVAANPDVPAIGSRNEHLVQGGLVWPLRLAIPRRRIVSQPAIIAPNHAPPATNPPTTSVR